MTAKEAWLDLKQRARIMSNAALEDAFCKWSEQFVQEAHAFNESFADWLQWPADKRHEALLALIRNGGLALFGTGPQQSALFLASLYHVLSFGRCVLISAMRLNQTLHRKITEAFEEFLGYPIYQVGAVVGNMTRLTYKDVREKPLVLCDYFMFADTVCREPAQIASGLPLLFFEIDSLLYANRLLFYDKDILHSSGMVYHTESDIYPSWKSSGNVFDIPDTLRQLKCRVSGSISYTSDVAAAELHNQFPYFFKKAPTANWKMAYSAFMFRKSAERGAAIVKDALKTEGDILIYFASEDVGKELMEIFRRSGQEALRALDNEDVVTKLSQGHGKHIILERQMSTTLFAPPAPLAPLTIFLADMFSTELSYAKFYAAGQRMGLMSQEFRLYFSQEDYLMEVYEEQGGWERFFALMEFTEKYDPWRQIRRVLAKLICRRLDKLRQRVLNDSMPIPVTTLYKRMPVQHVSTTQAQAAKAAKKTEGLCFCGSGKPFKECHGKPRKA